MDLVARDENYMVGGEEYAIILVDKEVGRAHALRSCFNFHNRL